MKERLRETRKWRIVIYVTFISGSILITSVECSDEVDMEKKTVKMRGSNTSVLVEGDGGKISTLYFEEDDDDDEDDEESEDEVEDFDDENALSFQVESLQEVDESGEQVLCVCVFCLFLFLFFAAALFQEEEFKSTVEKEQLVQSVGLFVDKSWIVLIELLI